jgi:hypothetical protein
MTSNDATEYERGVAEEAEHDSPLEGAIGIFLRDGLVV